LYLRGDRAAFRADLEAPPGCRAGRRRKCHPRGGTASSASSRAWRARCLPARLRTPTSSV
jgi:hypothetical protein